MLNKQKDLIASPGKFRVVCVDTFDGTDWIEGEYDTAEVALAKAKEKGGPMLKTHVYDDQGKNIGSEGKF